MEPNDMTFYIRSLFVAFTFFWLLLIVANRFYESFASLILLLPFGYFLIGFMNSEYICDKELEDDVLKVTFINTGILLSMPLLALIEDKLEESKHSRNLKKKEKTKILLHHVIFLAIIFILLSYPHIWVSCELRPLCKVVRSCLETFGVTLYMFALAIIFL